MKSGYLVSMQRFTSDISKIQSRNATYLTMTFRAESVKMTEFFFVIFVHSKLKERNKAKQCSLKILGGF